MSFHQLTTFEGKVTHSVDLVDEDGKKTGAISFQTEFVWSEIVPEVI